MYSVCKFRNTSLTLGKKLKEVLNLNHIILHSYNTDSNETQFYNAIKSPKHNINKTVLQHSTRFVLMWITEFFTQPATFMQ